MTIAIRAARPDDIDTIIAFIRALAEYERLAHEVKADRATLFNLLIGLNGYTISTGIITPDLNGNDIVAIRLDLEERITVGYIVHSSVGLSLAGSLFLEKLKTFAGKSI